MGTTENVDLYSFYTTKITRWKGNYPRIFSVGTHGIATYNPSDSERTNYWQWTEVFNVVPLPTPDHPHQFQLTHKKGKGSDTMRFESEHRDHILSLCLAQSGLFARGQGTDGVERSVLHFSGGGKFRWGQDFETKLHSVNVTSYGLEQVSLEGEKKSYMFKDMDGVVDLSDGVDGHTFCIRMKGTERLHTYRHPEKTRIVGRMVDNAAQFVGINVSSVKKEWRLEDVLETRLGIYAGDQHLTSLSEFPVQNVKRQRVLLCLSETCLVERDTGTYLVKSLHGLSSVFGLIRCEDDSQALKVELSSGQVRTYFSTERDSLLSSLMDGARAAGNCAVCVKSRGTPQGKRWGPVSGPVDEKVESMFLKFIHQPPPNWSFSELMVRFNANVQYSGLIHSTTATGLFAENKEKLILVALNALLVRDVNPADFEEFFQLVRRLVCSKTGFGAFSEMQMFREKIGNLAIQALKSTSDISIYSALDLISALMQPMHLDADLRIEQENKEKILNSSKFLDSLLEMWTGHVKRGTGALVTMAMLDILTFGLCAPYSETTMGGQFDFLIQAVATRASVLFSLFQHPSVAIVKGAGLVMKALIEEGQGNIGREIQDMALKEGALMRHLLNALFVQTSDPRLLTLRQLSRHLIVLWTSQNPAANELLKRIFPIGLLRFLESNEKVESPDEDLINTRDNLKIATAAHKMPSQLSRQVRNVEKFVEKQIEATLRHWRLKTAQEVRKQSQFRPVALRKRRQNLTQEGNWSLFYFHFSRDHAMPDLIWNYQTREELREALSGEIRLLDSDRDHVRGQICWNFADFQVPFRSLGDEIKVGGYYLRLLLEENLSGFVIREPREFFADLYHRFFLTGKPELRGMCLQAMTIVYERHWEEIGVFNDLKYIIIMLEKCQEKSERDRLVLFVQQLSHHPENSRELVGCGGLKVLVDLLTLAHLHTSRAVIHTQSNVIEAGEGMERADYPEWYYMRGGEKIGPVGFKELKNLYGKKEIDGRTKVWASGLETWKILSAIPQLKWYIVAEKQTGLMDESKLAKVVLDILIQVVSFCPAKIGDAVIRPVHKAKQVLSDPGGCLAHIVQVLLTFDPDVVERVATLLCLVLEENPVVGRVYATGVYFFIMMYTGSNILPISRFLHMSHLKQNTYSAQQGTSVWQKSVLGSLLPEAMVAYLENHGVDKFSEIYLGEFDTPEAIWSAAMRRHLIERIALHISDFTPRLLSNTRALYEYCAIPAVAYECLETELFCNVFYLRNLTDELRFPNWPIATPLQLLKDVLQAWKSEVEKQPPPMTVTDALRQLELENEENWQEKVKRNYRKLAQKYHPDKNPAGRERFEEANRAYEFLCSRYSKESDSPDPKRIILILKAQSILFKRYGDVLEPYKYAGYPMLIKTVELDVSDDTLFAQESPLLPHSAEVVYHTLNCSALNVEELRREKGLDLLLRAFDRCVAVLNKSSKPGETGVLVCGHVMNCFGVATRFQLCRDKLVEMPLLASHVCRVLEFEHLTKLSSVAAETVACMSVDTILQMHLLQSGVLWHLLKSLVNYDYTLEEAGVKAEEDSNEQVLKNNFAKKSVTALRCLCGDGAKIPVNDVIRASLDSLLLPYGGKMVREKEPEVVLKTLNSNCCNPYLIWNNKTRAELLEFCDEQLALLRSGENDMTYGCGFGYSAHKGELVVGSIFIRIYNQDPSFKLEDPKEFINHLLAYISTTDMNQQEPQLVNECLLALTNALKSNAGLESLCKGKFRLFARYLMSADYEKNILQVLTCLMSSQDCVGDVVGMGVVPGLLVVCGRSTTAETTLLCLNCFGMLVAHAQVVKEAIIKGAIIYLLELFGNDRIDPVIRQKSAELLSRLCSDKLSGPRVKILLSKFLPSIFPEAMEESGSSAVLLFDSTTENPEIVWTDEMRYRVRSEVSQLKNDLLHNQSRDLSFDFKLGESYKVNYANDELVVGGIYLRLYVSNQSWNIRKPREFLRDLLEYAFTPSVKKSSSDESEVELIGSSLGILLSTHPYLCDSLPAMGYMNKIMSTLETRQSAVILVSISKNPACVDSLCQTESSVKSIVIGMKKSKDIVGLACEALNHIYSHGKSELVGQAIRAELIPVLLGVLKNRDFGTAVKANVVHCLQFMERDERHGEEVKAVLAKSDVWAQYRDQKHDLFLSDNPIAGYLQGSSSVAGYLTQGSAAKSSIPNSPPPVIE